MLSQKKLLGFASELQHYFYRESFTGNLKWKLKILNINIIHNLGAFCLQLNLGKIVRSRNTFNNFVIGELRTR